MVRQAGNHRRHHDAHGNPRPGEHPNRFQPPRGNRGARFHGALQFRVQCGDRNKDHGCLMPRKLREQVRVPGHREVFGDHRRRVAKLGEHLQAPAGQAKAALGGLVAVGNAAQRDGGRRPARRHQLAAKQFGRVLLDQDTRFKVQPGGKPEVLVRRARITVGAPVLAPAVRVDAVREAHVGAVVPGDDGAGGIPEKPGLRAWIVRIRRQVIRREGKRLEAVRGVGGAAAPPDGYQICHGSAFIRCRGRAIGPHLAARVQHVRL